MYNLSWIWFSDGELSDKWNQWLSTKLKHGKTDDIQLHALVAYLRETHNMPNKLIKKDWFILFDNMDYSVISIVPYVTTQQMKSHPVVRRPDIIILDSDGKPQLIIELDGSIHHTKPGAKKTAKRNADYHFAQIPLIVIDFVDLKLLKKSWFEYLDEQLIKHSGKLSLTN